jgi:F5/8 type C domain-containing protein
MRRLAAVLAFLAVAMLGSAAQSQSSRLLDGFETLKPWEAKASEGVGSTASLVPGHDGKAMRLDFDFAGVSGYAFARRSLPVDLPANYEISFWIKADAPANTFEVKLTDASGENVWWRQTQNYDFPRVWTKVRIKRRQVEFAWGPTADKTLRRFDKVEFVVTRGRGGGKGSVWIDQLELTALPPDDAAPPRPVVLKATGAGAVSAIDGDPATAWIAPAGSASLTLDLRRRREFGGLTLHWIPGAHASAYVVSLSDDGAAWREVRRVTAGDGAADPLRLPESDARYLRLDLAGGPARLSEIAIEPLAFGASRTAFVQAIARRAPRGTYPRGLTEQPYWTLVGVDGGADSGLISEDGAIEVGRGGFTVEPFVREAGKLTGWADVKAEQSLQDGYLPIPTVAWRTPGWTLRTTAFATGEAKAPTLAARYELENLTDRPLSLELVLAVRPFQVNGPAQFLTTPGGVSPIRSLSWDKRAVLVDGKPRIFPLAPPQRFAASAFDAGELPAALSRAAASVADDATGLASGALVYRVDLAPRGKAVLGWTAPLAGAAPMAPAASPQAWLDAEQARVAAVWRERLNRVSVTTPAAGRPVTDTLRTSLAHMLMSRNGPILQPGTRSYDRSWIRDGAMMAESLVRLGHADEAAAYLRWYAPRAFDNGKVPCCVDARGADPTPENDSQGELIFLAAEVYRYTGDKALLRAVWPQVDGAVRYMDTLRLSERTAANQAPARRMLYGLMPPSISHEGYSAKPAYSYWDDFWALRGYKDAVFIAQALGETAAAARIAASRDQFAADLTASLTASAEVHGIDFIPGAADLGDFDATSTTIALAPGGEQANLPPALLDATFQRYWREFTARRDGTTAWDAYTPYELRTVGAFVRLGWRDRAHELLDYFFADRRPAAWNGWAEVVGRDAREPRFIGDMPHAWVSSDYIRSALDLFAYDNDADSALVLGAGVPAGWFDGEGVSVKGLYTAYGRLDYSARAANGRWTVSIAGAARPPGGFVLAWPFEGAPGMTRIDGRPARWIGRSLRLSGPGEVVVDLPQVSPASAPAQPR